MNTRDLGRALTTVDPVDPERLRRLDLEAMEADLLADLEDGFPPLSGEEVGRPRHRAWRPLLAGGAVAVAAVVAVVLVLAGGGSGGTSPAYGAELVRFAESTPLLLLEGPDWRVENVTEHKSRAGNEGQMEFLTGKAVTYRPGLIEGTVKTGERISGLEPAAVRRRKVELRWSDGESLAQAIEGQEGSLHPHGRHFTRLPVLGTTAFVDTRAEIFLNQGGPGDREMVALWTEDGALLTLRAAVPSLAAFEERLGWLTKVESQTWLEAMPAKVVDAADIGGTVREVLKGVPLPKTFAYSRVPEEGLTTARDEVVAKATGTVACLWLRQWGEARRSGDEAAEAEAVKALAGAKNWPVFREEGRPYPAGEIEEDAAAMPRGYWIYRGHPQNLLKHAESIGCARLGLPLVPEKQERQRENGVPPPPN
jgi:hypothetical protein